jgi:hypothetical protein
MVYSQGHPARITTEFYLPEGTIYTNISDNYLQAKLDTEAGSTDIVVSTKANLTGSLPQSPGSYKIRTEMTEGGVVNVTW